MNPITLNIDGQDYVFRYIPAPSRFRHACTLEIPFSKRKPERIVGEVNPFYMAETVLFRNEDRKPANYSWNAGVLKCLDLTGMPSETKFRKYSEYEKAVDAHDLFIRMPTEFEWEWAAMGGEDFKYAGCTNIGEVAWYRDNSGGRKQVVALKHPNGYGLYDMTGNVAEWTANWCDDYPPYRHKDDGDECVLRMSNYNYPDDSMEVTRRFCEPRGNGINNSVRLCFSANPVVLDKIREKGLMR